MRPKSYPPGFAISCSGKCGAGLILGTATSLEAGAAAMSEGWRQLPAGWTCPDCQSAAAGAKPSPGSEEASRSTLRST